MVRPSRGKCWLHRWLHDFGLRRLKVEVAARPLGHPTPIIHRRGPATAPRGGFWLLGFPPGPVRPSLDDLEATALRHGHHIDAVPSMDARSTCTNAGRSSQRRRLPPPGLQVARLQAHATTPSQLSAFALCPLSLYSSHHAG